MIKFARVPFSIAAFLAVCVIGLIGIWFYKEYKGLELEHVYRSVYQTPVYLGDIKLDTGSRPLWVYSSNSRLYITYFAREDIEERTLQGELIKKFIPRITETKAVPQGMARIEDRFMVADHVNGSLSLLDNAGKVVESFVETPNKSIFKPIGIYAKNKVYYVTDELVHGWMAIGNDGFLINVVEGKGDSYLEFPFSIAVTSDGKVLVSDPIRGRIKAFTCAGQYIYDIPSTQIGLGNPQGITIDAFDRIHVVDNGTGKIFVYDNFGKFMFTYGTGLKSPSTITVDNDKKVIYIADTDNSRLSVWGF